MWQTNLPPCSVAWDACADARLVDALLAAIDDGAFGLVDGLYAMGISSGGYMTSRMAVSYPGRFRALAVHSASYATCGGDLCAIPALPVDHAPTLVLHGALDDVAPLEAARDYHAALVAAGVDARMVVADGEGHEWVPPAVDEVPAWFRGR